MVPFFLALIAAAGFYGATLLVNTAFGSSQLVHRLATVVAAGILLGIAIADLIPEAIEYGSGGIVAPLSIAGGFLLLYAVETLTGGHTHHHEPHVGAHAHAHTHGHSHGGAATSGTQFDACVPAHPVLPFMVGLGLHNIADGFVIGAGHEASDTAASGVAFGILLHQLPVGLSFGAVLLASGLARGRARRAAVTTALMIPVGAIAVLALPDVSDTVLSVLIGGAAGALLYIATGHLLPEAHSEHRHKDVAIAFTIALLGTIGIVSALHETAHSDADYASDESGHVEPDEHDQETR